MLKIITNNNYKIARGHRILTDFIFYPKIPKKTPKRLRNINLLKNIGIYQYVTT